MLTVDGPSSHFASSAGAESFFILSRGVFFPCTMFMKPETDGMLHVDASASSNFSSQ